MMRRFLAVSLVLSMAGCSSGSESGMVSPDGGDDAATHDAATHDAATHDAATHDAATHDAATHDAASDATFTDASADAATDAAVDATPDAAADAANPVDAGPDADPTTILPGGRENFVYSLMGAIYNGAWARMGTWAFKADGTVADSYWRWDQKKTPKASSEANTLALRAKTGYTTAGCPQNCTVWTTKGFEPGTTPARRTGHWNFSSNGDVHILWPDGQNEYYKIIDNTSYVQLKLVTHDYKGVSTVYASVFGSNASLSAGVDIDTIKAGGSVNATFHEQNWDAVTNTKDAKLWFDQYLSCSASPCIQGNNPAVYHTYFAGDPAKDGRKTYWYHQLKSVALTSTCAQIKRGGHAYQLLQIIDDNGKFVGWVGAEVSLFSQNNGGSIITQTQMIRP